MTRKQSALVGLIAAMMLLVPTTAVAKAPLHGDMDLQFNLAWLDVGPQLEVPDWVGTITFEDEGVYPMAFFNTGTGRSFDSSPSGNIFFEETWVVYDELTWEFDDGGDLVVFEPGDVLLSGYDRGVSNLRNATYRMNGDVRVAEGPFAEWLGRSVHMMGDFVFYPFGAPQFAPGVLRIN